MDPEELLANVACPCGSGRLFAACHGAVPVDDAELRKSIVTAMKAAAIPPEFVYAYERTGLIVTTENRSKISAADLDEWDDALAEYRETHPTQLSFRND